MGEIIMTTSLEYSEQATVLYTQAQAKFNEPGDRTQEEHNNIRLMMDDAAKLRAQSKMARELEDALTGPESKMHIEPKSGNPLAPKSAAEWASFGAFLKAIHGTAAYGNWTPQLKESFVKIDDDPTPMFDMKNMGWVGATHGYQGKREVKDLTEAVGADGGFTVIPEYRNQLMMLTEF